MDGNERMKTLNLILNRHGSPVADGLATRWKRTKPVNIEIYRDNVGGWVQYIVNGNVLFDSRYVGEDVL